MNQKEYDKLKTLHDKHWYFLGKKKIINHIIKQYHNPSPTILDIGCGEGYFFDEYEGVGIEPCEIFKKENIINEPLESISLNKKFDIIIALDVLEHLEDDTIIHKFIDNNLKDDGMAIITVPAHRHLYNNHDKVHNHYRRYDKSDLKKLLNNYNAQVYYYNSLLYPIAYIVRKMSKGNDNLKLHLKPINLILTTIFSFERYIYKFNLNGLSLLSVVKK